MRGWHVEQDCPQCGAPVALEETDHMLSCGFCRVKFYMYAKDGHRYLLPPSGPMPADAAFFVPYWRFRGVILSCLPYKIANKRLDSTNRAFDLDSAPLTMGLRPQAMTLKFIQPDTPGRFMPPGINLPKALNRIDKRLTIIQKFGGGQTPFASAFIGETASLIYAPFYIKDGALHDGVLNTFLGDQPETVLDQAQPARKGAGLAVRFVPAICPYCGWDLDGDKKSLVAICQNCHKASATSAKGMNLIQYELLASNPHAEYYLPFYRIGVRSEGLKLDTRADLIRGANLPMAVQPSDEERPLFFWAPAFQAHANMYLRLARNVTVDQPPEQYLDRLPSSARLAPATTSLKDAVSGLKLYLAYMTQAKRALYPELPHIRIKPTSASLVYIPFNPVGGELVNQDYQISVPPSVAGLSF
jgi:hypothetical protein